MNTGGCLGSDLDEEPGGYEGQAAVLTIEAVVVGVEGKVVQVEEPETKKASGLDWNGQILER